MFTSWRKILHVHLCTFQGQNHSFGALSLMFIIESVTKKFFLLLFKLMIIFLYKFVSKSLIISSGQIPKNLITQNSIPKNSMTRERNWVAGGRLSHLRILYLLNTLLSHNVRI